MPYAGAIHLICFWHFADLLRRTRDVWFRGQRRHP